MPGEETPDSTEPDGPPVTLHTDDDGRIDEIVLGDTTIVDDVTPGEDVDLTQSLYEAGFELTTRSLESFLVEVDPDDLDENDPIRELYETDTPTDA